jgi:hypothetical protein
MNGRGGLWRRWECWKGVFSEEGIREREWFWGGIFFLNLFVNPKPFGVGFFEEAFPEPVTFGGRFFRRSIS